MKRPLLICVAFLMVTWVYAQGNFKFSKKSSKTVLDFRLINNLILLPVELNGVRLNFLLDTGVEETILFSVDDTPEITLENIEKVKLRGLGKEEHVEGLKSRGNRLVFEDMFDNNHMLYIVLDQSFNFSSHIGVPVNGIIGYQFFRNNLIEIDYDRKRIVIYHDPEKARRKYRRKMAVQPISIELKKPYLGTSVRQEAEPYAAKLLIDTGSSDAVWLFSEVSDKVTIPGTYFDDFLGRGFSGEIFGKRGRIRDFGFSGFSFKDPIAAFPDMTSIRHVNMVSGRLGSVGGEILKRFTVVFDYPNKQIFLKKGNEFHAPFHYNMSGLEIEHDGLQWVKETVELNTNMKGLEFDGNFNRRPADFHYKFELRPVFAVTSVREGSPAFEAGIRKGDILVSMNGKSAYRYSLQNITDLLRSEPDREIVLRLERNGNPVNANFRLRRML